MARLAFTGDAGFIDVTVALIDATVNWNLGTGLDQEQVAQGEEPDYDAGFAVFADEEGTDHGDGDQEFDGDDLVAQSRGSS